MIITEGKTIQEVCDELANVLINQGKRCVSTENNYTCLYGDEKGNHCAIGWLLPEDRIDLMEFDGDINDLVCKFKDLGPNHDFIMENMELLTNIQEQLHDTPSLISFVESKTHDVNLDAWKPWFEILERE